MKRMIMIILVAALAFPSFNAKASEAGDADSAAAVLEIACTGLKDGDRALYNVFDPNGRKIFSVALEGAGPRVF